jgi:hypothetical protein|tara:strand:- start:30985 stop:31119 length:135 start_codon:yes stop_codon:yes gene_type:complete
MTKWIRVFGHGDDGLVLAEQQPVPNTLAVWYISASVCFIVVDVF